MGQKAHIFSNSYPSADGLLTEPENKIEIDT